jgi:hypothetical protein
MRGESAMHHIQSVLVCRRQWKGSTALERWIVGSMRSKESGGKTKVEVEVTSVRMNGAEGLAN